MSKLYIGNLAAEANEAALRQLLQESGVGNVSSVLVKRGGYAFIDCPEQSTVDRAIEKLNGQIFMGSTLVVEPSVAGGRRNVLTRTLYLSNVPAHVRYEELERLLTPLGTVLKCEKISGGGGSGGSGGSGREDAPSPQPGGFQTIEVVFETPEEAENALKELSEVEIEGSLLQIESAMESRRGSSRGGAGGGGGGGAGGSGSGRSRSGPGSQTMSFGGGNQGPQRQPDFPLRVLVASEMVGAIIGRQGGTIRQITQQTRARVDVHRKENVGSLEKAITIYGNPENCTNACRRVLEVMQQEANNTNKGEISLKILSHNNLIGRIIGKGGSTIKRVMLETETKITVSSLNDVSSFNMERVITIKGTIDNMSRAEGMISAKLRQSYESDLQAMAPQSMMFPGLHPMAMMSTVGMGFSPSVRGTPPVAAPGMYPPGAAPYAQAGPAGVGVGGGGVYPPGMVPPTGSQQETSFLYIPNSAVGAIIGTRGSHIRNIIRFSGASVKITSLPEGTTAEPQAERKVTIVGTPEAQWKAQYLIFEKMREEGFMPAGEDVRLTVELLVASSQVGRIIGKGGQNVREMQRTTSSVIKLPEQGASTGEETTVHIIGNFFAVQSAQRRIRAMMSQQQPPLQQGAPMTMVSAGQRMRTSGGGGGGVSGGQGRGREQ